jgi:hypothetical protein
MASVAKIRNRLDGQWFKKWHINLHMKEERRWDFRKRKCLEKKS